MIDILIKSNYCEITIFTLIFLYQHMTMPNSSDLRKTMKVPDSLMVPLKEKICLFFQVDIQSSYFLISSGSFQFSVLEFTFQFELERCRHAGIFLAWTTGIFLFISFILTSKNLILILVKHMVKF